MNIPTIKNGAPESFPSKPDYLTCAWCGEDKDQLATDFHKRDGELVCQDCIESEIDAVEAIWGDR